MLNAAQSAYIAETAKFVEDKLRSADMWTCDYRPLDSHSFIFAADPNNPKKVWTFQELVQRQINKKAMG